MAVQARRCRPRGGPAILLGITLVFVFAACGRRLSRPGAGASEWVAGVKDAEISLDGAWKFTTSPQPEFWRNDVSSADWPKIEVPGECLMQGFEIKRDAAYPYKRQFDIPVDFAGKRVLLRFDGVYSYARVWVNGRFVRDHHGGFTTWECDITDLVSPGSSAWLTVEITDRTDDISYASGYAHHLIGGILRDVWLVALPPDHISRLDIDADWDSNARAATLKMAAGASLGDASRARLLFSLYDRAGRRVRLSPSAMDLTAARPSGEMLCRSQARLPWDAEHPNLYTLVASLKIGGKTVQESRRRIGFRRLELSGNRLLVNGRPIKLRGACRHDVHPLLGRRSTRELDRRDVLLAREANINFIRTSHYPPSRSFLEFCDEFGMYVEEETAACFVGTHRLLPEYAKVGATEDDPAYTERYLGQLREMVGRDRNHPSVIIWSIGNENLYGSNFQKEYDWLKAADPTRPVMFSYPGKVPAGVRCTDILSLHYPSAEGDLEQYGIRARNFSCGAAPVIFDEWAHVPCYDTTTLVEDPNVRNFWGESLKRFWDGAFESDALGGAIWGMIDDVFMLPSACVGYGEWGIIDGWRRRKPEFWHVKKAYSPVRVLATYVEAPAPGRPLVIPIANRFDSTTLDELTLRWTWRSQSLTAPLPALPPHGRGEFLLPGRDWRAGDTVLLQFFKGRRFVDEELISLGVPPPSKVQSSDRNSIHWTVERRPDGWRVSAGGFEFFVSRRTGLIEAARPGGQAPLLSGPYLYLRILEAQEAWNRYKFFETDPRNWRLEKVDLEVKGEAIEVRTAGRINGFPVRFRQILDARGTWDIDYELASASSPPTAASAGRPMGLGLSFDLDGAAWVEWQRRGLWSVYPEGHIGRLTGGVPLGPGPAPTYREEPAGGWNTDVWDFFLQGLTPPAGDAALLTNEARSLKENITRLTVGFEDGPENVRVLAEGDQAARLAGADGRRLRLIVLNAWDYPDIDWGNATRPFKIADRLFGRVRLRITKDR